MPAYSFKPRFRTPILAGEKRQTIRAKRARATKVGDTLHLFCGMRTKRCEKLGTAVCTRVEDIAIYEWSVRIDGRILFVIECERLARRDGFKTFAQMMEFWKGRLPFRGDIIHWKELL